jgi:hypothetical protein
MKVDYAANVADFETVLLGALGLSTDYIASVTKLTKCQVQYRLGKLQIRRTDYRNGRLPGMIDYSAGREFLAKKKHLKPTYQNLKIAGRRA